MTEHSDIQDELARRLRAADPAGPDVTASMGGSLPDLVEAIVTDTIETTTSTEPARPRRAWLIASAAAVAIGAASVGGYFAVRGDDAAPAKQKTVASLRGPSGGGTSSMSCIAFSVDVLKDMPVAFDGTVASVGTDSATLDVNHWYRGGTADQVQVNTYDSQAVALEGGVAFETGHRYLVTATDGTVNICGFTAEWSAETEQAFQQAFGG